MKKPKPKPDRNPSWPPPIKIMEWHEFRAMLEGRWSETGLPGCEGKKP